MSAATGGRRRSRAATCSCADHVPRRADDQGDGADLRGPRLRHARGVRRRPPQNARARAATSIRRRATSKATCFPRRTRCRDAQRRSSSCAMMVTRFRASVRRRTLRRQPRAPRASASRQARDAGVARREGNRRAGRAADRRRRVLATGLRSGWRCSAIRPSSTRSNASGRYDGNLTRGEPAGRLALQHVPLRRACRPARSPRRAAPRSRPPRSAERRAVPVLRQPQRRLARLRAHARRAQPQRAGVPGQVFREQRQKR